jgi:hypothetical protein
VLEFDARDLRLDDVVEWTLAAQRGIRPDAVVVEVHVPTDTARRRSPA